MLDSAAESYLLLDEIRAAGVPVLVHPPMSRVRNGSFETAARLAEAGIPFAIQTGFEGYVPKTRVLLWEAAIAAANGLGPERALEAVTLGAARILGVDDRVGSIEVGKDADLVLFDGDPFEYTRSCVRRDHRGRGAVQGVPLGPARRRRQDARRNAPSGPGRSVPAAPVPACASARKRAVSRDGEGAVGGTCGGAAVPVRCGKTPDRTWRH